MPKKPLYDLHHLSEDERIDIIGKSTAGGKSVSFMVDVEQGSHAKGDRYLRKLKERYPHVTVVNRKDGPVANVETILVQVRQ